MKKHRIQFLPTALAAVLALTACSNDQFNAPVITLAEVGHDNSHTAVCGDDIHLEADIVAEGTIDAIYLEMHLEEGNYEIEQQWTEGKYIGVKNTEFHEHIAIPSEAPAGEYHLHLTVTDRQGQQAQATDHVELINEPETSKKPIL